jgi:hypothetical protein
MRRPDQQRGPPAEVLGHRLVEGIEADRHHALVVVAASHLGAVHDRLAAAGEERELGELRPEHGAGAGEEDAHRRLDVLGLLEQAAGVVEELEVVGARPLRAVPAVGGEDRHQRQHQQADRRRLEPHHGGDDDREGGHHRGAEQRADHDAHRRSRREARLCRRHRRTDEQGADRPRRRRAGEDGQPSRRARRALPPEHGLEGDQGDGGGDRQRSAVEDQRVRGLAAVQQQRGAGPGELPQEQPARAAEEQPEHQRDLAQGEGVCVATHVEVHHADLGDEEEHGELPPAHREGGVQRAGAADDEHRGPGASEEHRGGDGPDAQQPQVTRQAHAATPRGHRVSVVRTTCCRSRRRGAPPEPRRSRRAAVGSPSARGAANRWGGPPRRGAWASPFGPALALG